jgi:hypothetical protein
MINGNRKSPKLRLPTIALVEKALSEAAGDAVESHRRANQPLVIWKDGQTVLVDASKAASDSETR